MTSSPPPDRSGDESTPPLPVTSDGLELAIDGNVTQATVKKPAWCKPSSCTPVEVGPIIGGEVSWPPLLESARASPRPSLPDPPKDPTPAPVIASPTKKPNQNPNPNSVRNQPALARHKSMKRGGGGDSSSSSSSSVPVNGGHGRIVDEQPPAEVPPMEPVNKGNQNGDHGFRGSGPDHQRSYGGGRRGSNGGNGPHHNTFGHRRDQDWGHRSFNGRDGHMQPMQHPRGGGPRPYLRPAPPAAAAAAVATAPSFIGPPPLQSQPFGPPIGFPDMNSALYPMPAPPPPETFGGVPFITHAVSQALYLPAVDSSHRAALLKQIDYYFSTQNLCKDTYLRQKMDDQGWVPVSLIAGFNKVQQLTNNIHYILDTVQYSTVVEVQGDKIRRRNDWMNWMLPQPNSFGNASGQQSTTPNYDALAVRMQAIGLEDGFTNNSRRGSTTTAMALGRSSSGNVNDQSQAPFVDGNGQIPVYTDKYRKSTRNLSRSDTL